MSTTALIIFVRNPVLGKVKSRIAQTLGAEKTLRIYEKLLEHTHSITEDINVDKYVFYSDVIDHDDLWEKEIYHKELQNGLDIGERMKNAFKFLFDKGYGEIVIIGSDCYELTEEIILVAIKELQNNDAVIGPATDGGYYLLGMNILIPQLFENKTWSSSQVYLQTVDEIWSLNYSLHELNMLSDVDEEKDITFL